MIKINDKEPDTSKNIWAKFGKDISKYHNWSNEEDFSESPENLIEKSKRKRQELKMQKDEF